jgi:uncharacterized membrane protein YjfL (UPF0719 family)
MHYTLIALELQTLYRSLVLILYTDVLEHLNPPAKQSREIRKKNTPFKLASGGAQNPISRMFSSALLSSISARIALVIFHNL